jgi:hypothetical protein
VPVVQHCPADYLRKVDIFQDLFREEIESLFQGTAPDIANRTSRQSLALPASSIPGVMAVS